MASNSTRLVLRTATSEILRRSNKDSTKRMSRRDKPIPSLELTYLHPRYGLKMDAFPFPKVGYVSVPCRINLPPLWTVLFLQGVRCSRLNWYQMKSASPSEVGGRLPGRWVNYCWRKPRIFVWGIFILKVAEDATFLDNVSSWWLNHHIDWLRTRKWFPPHICSMKSDKKPSIYIACHELVSIAVWKWETILTLLP